MTARLRLVDAEPVRQHVIGLNRTGLPYATVIRLARVRAMVVSRLLYGEPARAQPPSRRIRPEHARALLSVRSEQIDDGCRVLAAGTRRRLQALVRAGWLYGRIGEEMGASGHHLGKVANGHNRTVSAATAKAVAAVYDRLWDVDPIAAGVPAAKSAQVRTMAIRNGWLLPLAWDDDLIDLSEEDLAAELRRQAGLMSSAELARARRAYREQGDTTPLTVEATREYKRRQRQQRSELGEAS